MFFELCVHDGQALVRQAVLSADSSGLKEGSFGAAWAKKGGGHSGDA